MRRTYQLIIVAVAALSAAGIALAQDHFGGSGGVATGFSPREAFTPPVQPLGSHWTNPELWDGYDDPGRPVGRELRPLPSAVQTRMAQQVLDELKIAVPQMREACAVDQQKLCAGKKSNLATDRCLEYFRLKLSTPCKQAWDQVSMAAEGRL